MVSVALSAMTKRKLTPKQRVLRKYPNAAAVKHGPQNWHICLYEGKSLRKYESFVRKLPAPAKAWADAAARIERKK